jgi:hypothetical protein
MTTRLWALDLDTSSATQYHKGRPWRAHLIVSYVDPIDGQWPDRLTAACGQVFSRANDLTTGWWSVRAGEYPLAEHAIHCGLEGSSDGSEPLRPE